MNKEACIVIIDVGRSMGIIGSDGKSGLDKAKSAVRQMITNKLIIGKKQDEMGILLVGSVETFNQLNNEAGEGYDNIRTLSLLQKPSLKLLEELDAIEVEEAEGDVIDSLLVAMGTLLDRVKKLKFTKRIYLATALGGAINLDDSDSIDKIIDTINSNGFKLNVLGVGFGDAPERDENGSFRYPEPVSRNVQFLHEFTQRIGSDGGEAAAACIDVNDAMQVLCSFRKASVNQVTKFRGPLELSSVVHIPVYTYAKTMTKNLPSLKRQTIAQSRDGLQSINDNEAEEGEGQEEGKGMRGGVKRELTYWDKQAAEEEEVKEKVRSYRYGKQLIPFLAIDESVLKWQAEKCLKLLGFTDAKGPDVCLALSALIHACQETDRVMVCRYVKRANATPVLAVLYPDIKNEVECFYLAHFPFLEDIREYSFNSLTSFAPNEAQARAANALIDSMDLMRSKDNDEERLQPEVTFNPVIQRFFDTVQTKALDPSAQVPALHPAIAAYMNPDFSDMPEAKAALASFRNVFPLVKTVDKKKTEKRHWRDAMKPVELDPALKRVCEEKEQASVELKLDAMSARVVDKVGSMNPVNDFQALLKRRDSPEWVGKAIKEMFAMVKTIVAHSFGDSNFPKAVECLEACRRGCVQEQEPVLYNDGLRDLQNLYAKKNEILWKKIASSALGPITSAEAAGSRVSVVEALGFFGSQASVSGSEPEAAPLPAPEDLFDDLM